MSQSLYTSMGGIAAATTQLSVISNNVANINTTAFKSSSVQFSDVYSTTLSYGSVATSESGGTNPVQVGVGVEVSAVSTDFSTGSWVSTGSDTDLMINGSGFFTVEAADGSTYYTRSGNFSLDANGNLVTTDGYKVLGTDSALSSTSSGVTVQIPTSITATITGNPNLGLQLMSNLNGIDNTITTGNFTITRTTAAGVAVGTYTISLAAADLATNVTTMITAINADLTATGANLTAAVDATTGAITFTNNGGTGTDLISFSTPAVGGSNFVGQTGITTAPTAIGTGVETDTLDWIVNITDLSSATESTSANSTTINNDGTLEVTYKDGSTLSVELDTNGYYDFIYTTADSIKIDGNNCTVDASVAVPANLVIQMATITNTEGLLATGSSLYAAGPNTGDVIYTIAGKMGCGEVQSGGLEASNVDLSKELSNMILAQRAIQANSRVFTTTSDIMQTITQMGR